MRIAQVATAGTPVLPAGGGSIELIVWLLGSELERAGHDVTTFAVAGSQPAGRLVETLPGPYATPGTVGDWHLAEFLGLTTALEQSDRFDVLHAHAYLWSLALEPLARCPVVHTTHILPANDEVTLRRTRPDACVTGLSEYQWSAYPDLPATAVIPHGVDPGEHPFSPEPNDYLLYFGRFDPGKNPIGAIGIAESIGARLLMAGPPNAYFRDVVEPRLEGTRAEYVGSPTRAERNALLGGARALLYPILSPEPFGLVLIEAMMCGTPVAGTALGAVEEIVEEGLTGSVAPPGDDLAGAIERCVALDRAAIRSRAVERFSAERMAADYAALYERVIAGTVGSPSAGAVRS